MVEIPGEMYRVFCPKHDEFDARYHTGRPLLDDSCPTCVIERLTAALGIGEVPCKHEWFEGRCIHCQLPPIQRGWRLVPVEPTPEMKYAGRTLNSPMGQEIAEATYRAMLAAAPASPEP